MERYRTAISSPMLKFMLPAVIAAIMFAVWGWQQLYAFFQAGAAAGESIRVAERDACVLADREAPQPHFSGCNSIL